MVNPKDLRAPFSFATRRVLLVDRVFHVPSYYSNYQEFEFPGWNSKEIFGNDRPVNVEYCSGNGDWIVGKAEAHPDSNWVAVEKQFKRVRKIWSKMTNKKLSNLFLICGEAQSVTEHYFPTSSLSAAYINFPDPWPKKRHEKHRLVSPPFIKQVHRALQPDAPFMLVTDHPDYAERFVAQVGEHPGFSPQLPAPHWAHTYRDYGDSWFERLWRAKGRDIHYIPFTRRSACA